MARSRNKYSRARIRSRVRKPRRRGGSQWFYGALALIVAAGVVGIVAARPGNQGLGPHPQPADPATGQFRDHWHSAFAVDICGTFIDPPQTFETVHDNPNVAAGLHTHGDGFIHIHPRTRSESGEHATLGEFMTFGGWGVSSSSLDLGTDAAAWAGLKVDPSKRTWSNGDKCPKSTPDAGKPGVLKWSVDCIAKKGNPSDYRLQDLQVVALAFIPKSQSIPTPPNATATPQQDQKNVSPKALNIKTCTTAGPGGTITTSTTGAATTDTTTGTTTATTTGVTKTSKP